MYSWLWDSFLGNCYINLCLPILAVSFQALSYFSAPFLSLSFSLAHAHMLRHTQSLLLPLPPHCLCFPQFFTLLDSHWFGARACGCSKHSSAAPRKLAERKEHFPISAPSDIRRWGADVNMHACTILHRCARTPSINNGIEHGAKWQPYWQEPRCVQ